MKSQVFKLQDDGVRERFEKHVAGNNPLVISEVTMNLQEACNFQNALGGNIKGFFQPGGAGDDWRIYVVLDPRQL